MPPLPGPWRDWEDAPESALALVMLLDQVPRHIFRSTAARLGQRSSRARRREPGARRGFDRAVPPAWRLFFYMPFEHSENLEDQRRGLD